VRPPSRPHRIPALNAFRGILIFAWSVLAAYSAVVIADNGLAFLPTFFADVAAMGWPGRFDLDLACFVALSALWTAWRDDFSATALALAALALVGGAGFLLAYLIVLSLRTDGDLRRMLLGDRRSG
jgi:hypothetical protein